MTPLQRKDQARPEKAEMRKLRHEGRPLLCRRMEQHQGRKGKPATARSPADLERYAGLFRGENVAHIRIG
jgi:hypothetical protein